ncbi:hypothetical protein [Peribacillus sp. R9-11]|uniref:hypothetical protein n=1 Tax=Peribacillus sp. R9-11 TaxID=3073271 RepID=UPI002869148D|nr:hypothetical protein [Peribacillus sp. R9-11]WMX58625.1 hypothetical protein RE409_29460 [Peribacillus sp. R9-11]
MLKPFENISNRKLRTFEELFYFRNETPPETYKLPFVVYKSILNDYKKIELFKKHLITISHENNLSKDFYNMALNFKKAAREAAEFLVNRPNIGKLDTVFFAVTYMYRQSIELIMKARVFQLIEAAQERKEFMTDAAHNLKKIFEVIEARTDEMYKTSESLLWLKTFISNISKIDLSSDSFRYPYRIIKDHLFETYEFEYVFNERKDICLEKLINKLDIAFTLMQEQYELNVSGLSLQSDWETNDHEIAINETYSTDFLEEGGDYYAKSVIGYEYNKSELYLYIQAYQEAADHLYVKAVEQVVSGKESNQKLAGTFYLPICYLYRNAIELALKDLCFVTYGYTDALEVIYTRKHKLESIWNHIKCHYPKYLNIDIPTDHKEEIDKALKLVHEADATSSKFRYPIDKNLKYYYTNNSRIHLAYDYYNLRHCLNIIEGLTYKTRDYIDSIEVHYD